MTSRVTMNTSTIAIRGLYRSHRRFLHPLLVGNIRPNSSAIAPFLRQPPPMFPQQSLLRRCLSSDDATNSMFPNYSDLSIGNNQDDGTKGNRGKKKKKKKQFGKPSYRFVDRTRLRASAGSGGKGSLSLHHVGRKRKVRPDGGHGGDGGSVIIFADPNEQSLRMSSPHVQASEGTNGADQDKFGRKGKNKIVRVPCGVIVKRFLDYNERWDPVKREVTRIEGESNMGYDNNIFMAGEENYDDPEDDSDAYESDSHQESDTAEETQDYADDMVGWNDADVIEDGFYTRQDDDDDNEAEFYGEREKVVLADLEKAGDFVVVARGGKGGYGSGLFSSMHGGLPDAKVLAKTARPKPGEVAFLELELKLIADIGLVGFPNAGKSSLLNAMSRAGPQVAPYPFTTLHPFVGVVEYRDGFRLRAADIPGLIDGASEGRGKGHDFLRHVERTKALLYIVDAAGSDGRDPIEDLKILANELLSYGDGDMMNRQALVVANKLDLLEDDEELEVMSKLATAAKDMGIKVHGDVIGISAGVTGTGLSRLSQEMRDVVLQSEIGKNIEDEE